MDQRAQDDTAVRVARLRLRLGLSQTALAERLGVSFSSVSRWERGRARASGAALLQIVRLEHDGLGAPQPHSMRPSASARRHSNGGSVAEPSAPSTNLPVALTSFVGRARELEQLQRLLHGVRLLTLTGTGGVGKTRLALELARSRLTEYPAGVWCVELAALADPALVSQAVAAALDVRLGPRRVLHDALHQRFAGRPALLVFDNCEHLVDTVADLAADLLRFCPELQIVATSRAPLGVEGEMTWRVPSLSLPVGDASSSEPLTDSEAVQLFVARAVAVEPGFVMTPDEAAAVGELCRRLDGIPLAIELASTRVRVLAPRQILERVTDRFAFLVGGHRTAPERHRTLRAAVGWSYGLLDAAERELFNRLAVFSGGFTLAAAEAVSNGNEGARAPTPKHDSRLTTHASVLDLLTGLVEKSLVLQERRGDEARFRLLETLRQSAAERLAAVGELDDTRRRHAEFYLGLAEAAAPELEGPQQADWLLQLALEYDNLRVALGYLTTTGRQDELALRLALPLFLFWDVRGYYREGLGWLAAALDRAGDTVTPARAWALSRMGGLSMRQGDQVAARAYTEQSLALFRELGDMPAIARLLSNGGTLAFLEGDLDAARIRFHECVTLCRELGDGPLLANTLNNRGALETTAGNLETATAFLDECARVSREVGYTRGLAYALLGLGWIAAAQRDERKTAASIGESLRFGQTLGDRRLQAYCIAVLAGAAFRQRQFVRAARLFAASASLLGAMEASRIEPIPAEADHLAAALRTELDAEAFDTAWAEGSAMHLDDALAYALATDVEAADSQSAGPRQPGPASELSEREREVLQLLVEGSSNKEIAATLALSVRTVEHHTTNIYAKLGVRGKAGAVARALQSGLIVPAGSL